MRTRKEARIARLSCTCHSTNFSRIQTKRLLCRKLMDLRLFQFRFCLRFLLGLVGHRGRPFCDRMPFSCAIIKRKVAILSLSILPLDGRRRPSPQSWPLPISFLPHTWRPWRTLREPFFRPPSAMALQDAAPRKWSPWLARDYRKHWHFRLFSAFQTPRGRAARAPTAQPLPSLFPLCRSSVRLGLKPPFIRIE